MTLTLAQWIAFTQSAAASTERLIEAETDQTALLILRSGLSSLHRQLEVLRMTDRELAPHRSRRTRRSPAPTTSASTRSRSSSTAGRSSPATS
jgi:hypothetical protein